MLPSISVWPSAALRASAVAPSVAPAPGLLSTLTAWPRRAASFSAMRRATTSTPPPGGYGAISVSGFAG